MQLFVADPPVAASVWAVVMPWLEPAIARAGDTDAHEVMTLVNAGEAQLWTAWGDDVCRAALVTTRHGDTLHLWLCGGHGCDWAQLLRRILSFSKSQGITKWTMDGRKGWHRALKDVPQTF